MLNKDLCYTSSQHFGPHPPAGASAEAAGRGSPGCFFGARKNSCCTVSFGLPFATGRERLPVAGSGWPSTIAGGNTAACPRLHPAASLDPSGSFAGRRATRCGSTGPRRFTQVSCLSIFRLTGGWSKGLSRNSRVRCTCHHAQAPRVAPLHTARQAHFTPTSGPSTCSLCLQASPPSVSRREAAKATDPRSLQLLSVGSTGRWKPSLCSTDGILRRTIARSAPKRRRCQAMADAHMIAISRPTFGEDEAPCAAFLIRL